MNNTDALIEAIKFTTEGITISDPKRADNPIIYANEGFCSMTGYDLEEIVGRNCRFLQGKNTDKKTIKTLKKAMDNGESVSVELYNYRKNGEGFWNRLNITPIMDKGEVLYFAGFQYDITALKTATDLLENNHLELTKMLKLVSSDMQKTIKDVETSRSDADETKRHCTKLLSDASLIMTMIESNSTDIMQFVSTTRKSA